MSTFLYRLGHLVARARFRFLAAWFFLAVITFGISGLIGGQLVNDYTIPGTESQRGIDTLSERFPQASGTTGQIVFESKSGPIADQKDDIEKVIKSIEKVKHVTSVDDPFASGAVGTISANKLFAQSQIQFDVAQTDLPENTVPEVEKAAEPPSGAKFTVTLGGDMYTSTGAGIGLTDIIGVVAAFFVLTITFRSLLAAGMPLLTAILGVATTLAAILIVAEFTTISSTTPSLALMIGLAVGIDYGLFVVTRHRRQLAHGMSVPESIAQALATAGSAVVFAGTTVIIALCGLAVAQIPFLSVMGWAAASGVAVAVAAALTLLPALLGIFGEHLRPKPTSRTTRLASAATSGQKTMGGFWVAVVTKVPAVTVIVVLIGLGVMVTPIKDLSLALPDNGSSEIGSPERTSYDLIAKEFGPGYNSPLLVTADVINSTDPKTTVNDLATDIGKLPGVLAVTKQTPNETGDLGLVRVVPAWAQSDPRTTALVGEIRAKAPSLEKSLKISDMTVTGTTAVAIDVNTRLAGALVPFAVVVVGLALILLMIVFRSVAVPIKATLGYLLSIGAALGAVTAVFIWGWFAEELNVSYIGPVVSFMPIILMGVLFGLAMDYEVFLVSAIREDYVHGHDARHAIRTGFISSARVVTAAAIIMICVFTAFIPEGSSTIKPIALGLAVGVFVDAFLVRMTLVPAVLALLGKAAWWMPTALDRTLPHIDVEGAALVRHVEQVEWEEQHGQFAVRAEGVLVDSSAGPVATDLLIRHGVLFTIEHNDARLRSALVWTLAGRHRPEGGELAVLGHVLPEEAGQVRDKARVVTAPSEADDPLSVRQHLSTILLAQGEGLFRGRAKRLAIAQAEEWFQQVGAPMPALKKQRMGTLTVLQRRIVDLSGAAVQQPGLIIVEDADRDLDDDALQRFGLLCQRLVQASGDASLIVIGQRVGLLAAVAQLPEPPAPEPDQADEADEADELTDEPTDQPVARRAEGAQA
jgi:putative drug exporter of the RND superfamily